MQWVRCALCAQSCSILAFFFPAARSYAHSSLCACVLVLVSAPLRWYGSNGADVGFFAAAYVRLDDSEA